MATSAQVIGASILFAVYAVFVLYFVIKGARGTKNIKDYAVGSFTFSPVYVALSLAAAMTSAATFVINPGLIATYGLSAYISYGLVFPFASLASLVILTKSFRKYGQSVKALTLSSWVGNRYNSKGYALFVAILTVLLLAFIVLILVALVKVVAQALNANQIVVLAVVVAFTFGYMMFGGANSMVYTNVIQASLMILVALILLGSGFQFFKDGFFGFFEKLRVIDPQLVKFPNEQSPLFRDFFEIVIAQLVVGAAVVAQPHIITKSLLLKKEKDVNKFLVVSVIVQFLFFSVVFVGLFARLLFPDLTLNGEPINVDSVIPNYVITVFSGGIGSLLVGLLVILGLISAGFSTIEGLIQSLSTTITTDLIKPLFGKSIKNENSYIAINRVVIAIMAVVAFFMSREQIINPNVSVAIFAQNGTYSYFSILIVPLVFGIFLKNAKLKSALSGSITALVVYFVVYYLLPYLYKSGIASFGFANRYFGDQVQNPGIAACIAILAAFEIDWTWGDVAYGVGGNFGGGFSADQVNLQTQNLEIEINPTKGLYINLGLQRIFDTPYNPYTTLFDKMTLTGYRLAYFGTDGVGVSVRKDWDFSRLKAGYYKLYENYIHLDDDVTLMELNGEKDVSRAWKVGGSVYYLRDRGNGAGGVSILGQGFNSLLASHNGTFRFNYGAVPYHADVVWLGTFFSRNADTWLDPWTVTGFVNVNLGQANTLDSSTEKYTKATSIFGFAANTRLSYRFGQTPNDNVALDVLYTSGDADALQDGKYSGVITGNQWGAPGAIYVSSGSYLLMPHGNVVNRFTPAVMDISNMGYGLTYANLSASKGIIPNKLNAKVGVSAGLSNVQPTGGGAFIGVEANGNIQYNLGPYMSLELHGAYLSLGNFYDSKQAAYGSPVNGGVDERPVNPWTAFLVFKWLMF